MAILPAGSSDDGEDVERTSAKWLEGVRAASMILWPNLSIAATAAMDDERWHGDKVPSGLHRSGTPAKPEAALA